MHLRLGVGDAAERATHDGAETLSILAGEIDPTIVERKTRRRDSKMSEPFETSRALLLEKISRVKIVDLGGVMAAEHGRIEARHRAHGGFAGL